MSYRGGDDRGRGRGRGDFRGGGRGGGDRGGGPPRGGYEGGDRGRGRGGPGGYDGGRGGGGPPGRGRGAPSPLPPLNLGPAVLDSRLAPAALDQHVKSLAAVRTQGGGGQLPIRPGFGVQGTEIKLRANYFPIPVFPTNLYEYDVKITPGTKIRRVKRRLFELMERHPLFAPFAKFTAVDGSSKLISARVLPFGDQVLDIPIKLFDEDEKEDESSKTYVISLAYIKEHETSILKRYLNGEPSLHDFDSAPIVAALNIVLAKHATRSGISVGTNRFFFPTEKSSLDGLLDAYKGFYSSVRPTFRQLSVNLNVATTAFYKAGNLGEAINTFQRLYGGNLNGFVKGLRVKTLHLGYKKTVLRVAHRTPRQETFFFEQAARKVSVEEYFQRQYNKKLRFPDLPLVDLGTKVKPNFVPAELCEILPDQPFRGKLTGAQTREMIDIACVPPSQNQRLIIENGLQRLGFVPGSETLSAFGIQMGGSMAVVPGRILPPPSIGYAGKSANIRDSAWNLQGLRFHSGAAMVNCGALVIGDGGRSEFQSASDPALFKIIQDFTNMCGVSGMRTANAKWQYAYAALPSRREDPNRDKAMRKIEDTLKSMKKPDIVLVILSSDDKVIYSGIKYLCDVRLNVLTVCVQSQKFRKEQRQEQYFANVALKFNMKLGGINHVLMTGSGPLNWLTSKRTMLIGCDVTHPSPGSLEGTPSIAAVVASNDNNFAQYPASLRLQESRKEMITHLDEMIIERLKVYEKVNGAGKFPERIVMYRDGVSEGQFMTVLREELPQIRDACRRVAPGYSPKLSIAIAGKRHHTRFYPVDDSGTDVRNNGNPKAGTVVDKGVTGVYTFDFFLQSHAGLKGTARPTHYTVILDECGFTADTLQQLTHALSHTFSRATRGVSLVPPAYYADLACERGRCYIHGLLNATDAASAAMGNSGSDASAVFASAQKIWMSGPGGFVRERMFYI